MVDAQDCQPPHRLTSHPHQTKSNAVRVDIGQWHLNCASPETKPGHWLSGENKISKKLLVFTNTLSAIDSAILIPHQRHRLLTLTPRAEPALLGKNPKIARTRGWSFSFLQFCTSNLECDISYSKAHWSILRCVGIQRNKSFYIKLYLWFDSLFVLVPGNLSIFLYIKSTNYLYHILLLVRPPNLYWSRNSPGFALCSFFLRLHLKKYKLSKNNPRNCQKSFWERVLAGLRRRKEAL